MKKRLLLSLLILWSLGVQAQNVGIGTTIPSEKLEVVGNTKITGNIKLNDTLKARRVSIGSDSSKYPLFVKAQGIGVAQVSNTGATALGFFVADGAAYVQTHTNDDLKFATNNVSTQMVLQTGTGNFGINTTNPSQKLEVTGNVRINGVLQMTGGNPDAGKVLTSDATGNASWQPVTLPAASTAFFALFPFSGNTTIANNTNTIIPFVDNESSGGIAGADNGNNFNNTTHRFTAPTSGLYQFSYTVRFLGGNATQDGTFFMNLMVDNVLIRRQSFPIQNGRSTASATLSDSAILPLQTGDEVYVQVSQSSGISVDCWNTVNTHFSGYKIN